jgi:hypothetical protein
MSGTFLEIVAFDTMFKHEAEGLSQHTPPPSEAMSPFSFKADDEILELLPPRVDRANAIACDACYTSKRGVILYLKKVLTIVCQEPTLSTF